MTMAKKIARQMIDPLQVRARLYRQIGRVLDDLESKKCDLTIRERIAALALLIRYDFGHAGEGDEQATAGSAVREYAAAFRANAARRAARNDSVEEDEDDPAA